MRTDLPTKPPTGLTLRPYAGADDVPVIVDIINRELEHDGVPFRESVGDMGARYAHPSAMFEPARDVTIAEVDGVPVAYGERSWVDTTLDSLREYRVDGAVLPQWRRRGIGTALHRENVRRAREPAALHQSDRARVFFEMRRRLKEPIPDLPLPDGLEVRPITPDLVHQVWRADIEAFQDHWGGFGDS